MSVADIKDLEKGKFDELGNVKVSSNGDIGGLLDGLSYDDIQVTYPNSTTENFSYYLSESLIATIEVTYSDSTKAILLRARLV